MIFILDDENCGSEQNTCWSRTRNVNLQACRRIERWKEPPIGDGGGVSLWEKIKRWDSVRHIDRCSTIRHVWRRRRSLSQKSFDDKLVPAMAVVSRQHKVIDRVTLNFRRQCTLSLIDCQPADTLYFNTEQTREKKNVWQARAMLCFYPFF